MDNALEVVTEWLGMDLKLWQAVVSAPAVLLPALLTYWRWGRAVVGWFAPGPQAPLTGTAGLIEEQLEKHGGWEIRNASALRWRDRGVTNGRVSVTNGGTILVGGDDVTGEFRRHERRRLVRLGREFYRSLVAEGARQEKADRAARILGKLTEPRGKTSGSGTLVKFDANGNRMP